MITVLTVQRPLLTRDCNLLSFSSSWDFSKASISFWTTWVESPFFPPPQNLRQLGVVGKFVEFFGPGVAELSIADRATISNMCPEYGATVGFFPPDAATLEYLRQTGTYEWTRLEWSWWLCWNSFEFFCFFLNFLKQFKRQLMSTTNRIFFFFSVLLSLWLTRCGVESNHSYLGDSLFYCHDRQGETSPGYR